MPGTHTRQAAPNTPPQFLRIHDDKRCPDVTQQRSTSVNSRAEGSTTPSRSRAQPQTTPAPVLHVVHRASTKPTRTKRAARTRHRRAVGGPRGTRIPRQAHARTAAVHRTTRRGVRAAGTQRALQHRCETRVLMIAARCEANCQVACIDRVVQKRQCCARGAPRPNLVPSHITTSCHLSTPGPHTATSQASSLPPSSASADKTRALT